MILRTIFLAFILLSGCNTNSDLKKNHWTNIPVYKLSIADKNYDELEKLLLSGKVNLNEIDPNSGMNVIQFMTQYEGCDADIMALLIRHGAKSEPYMSKGRISPKLQVALFSGNFDCAKYLINNGENINLLSSINQTALHSAVHAHNYEIAKLLIDSHIDIKARNLKGFTALDYAKEYRDLYLEKKVLTNENYNNNQKILELIELKIKENSKKK